MVMRKFLYWLGWILMTLIALYLSAVTLVYFSFRPDVYFLLAKQDVVNFLPWRLAFYVHITGGLIALAVGPFQFLEKFRAKHLKLHRLLGKIYVTAILCLGGPAGFFMAFFANGGPWADLGFIFMAFCWIGTTWLGLRAIMKKDLMNHIRWMIRSYALCFAAVTLRILTPMLSLVFHIKLAYILIAVAWLSWMINLAVAELIIFLKYRKRTPSIDKLQHLINSSSHSL
jgi:uncharacterized membrane protein